MSTGRAWNRVEKLDDQDGGEGDREVGQPLHTVILPCPTARAARGHLA